MSAILKQKLIDIANGFTKYGLWKGGGSSSLSEMKDVTFTNLKENDVLKYNGSKWINDDNLQEQIDTLNRNFVSLENLIGGTKNFVSLDSYLNLSGMFIATINGTASPTGSQYGKVSVIVNTTSSRGIVIVSIPNGLYLNTLWNGSWSGWNNLSQ